MAIISCMKRHSIFKYLYAWVVCCCLFAVAHASAAQVLSEELRLQSDTLKKNIEEEALRLVPASPQIEWAEGSSNLEVVFPNTGLHYVHEARTGKIYVRFRECSYMWAYSKDSEKYEEQAEPSSCRSKYLNFRQVSAHLPFLITSQAYVKNKYTSSVWLVMIKLSGQAGSLVQSFRDTGGKLPIVTVGDRSTSKQAWTGPKGLSMTEEMVSSRIVHVISENDHPLFRFSWDLNTGWSTITVEQAPYAVIGDYEKAGFRVIKDFWDGKIAGLKDIKRSLDNDAGLE